MAFFRSEKMTLWHMLLHMETAFDCMVELGELGLVQFNSSSEEDHIPNMMYTYEVRRCMDLQNIIDSILTEMEDAKMEMKYLDDVDVQYKPKESDIPYIESQLQKINDDLKALTGNRDDLQKRRAFLVEWYHVITEANKFLVNDDQSSQLLYSDDEIQSILHDDSKVESTSGSQLHYVAGTINVDKFESFKLMLFRFFGLNVLVRNALIPETDKEIETKKDKKKSKCAQKKDKKKKASTRKHVVLVMNISGSTRTKILKLCHAFHVTLYECPESAEIRNQKVAEIEEELNRIDKILEESNKLRANILERVNEDLYVWKVNIKKAMMVYVMLNKLNIFDHIDDQKYLHAEVWIPNDETEKVRLALLRGSNNNEENPQSGNQFVPLMLKRKRRFEQLEPTFFRTNKFTQGFQKIIDAYGIADYRELNPAPYTIITFPFLFAVMFGDFGHGIILTAFATYLILNEKKLEYKNRTSKTDNEIVSILFAGRYIILLMGLFSIYTGIIYNDVLSKSFKIFPSCWTVRYSASELSGATDVEYQLDPKSPSFYRGYPYWLGMDPMWDISGEDAITEFNSLKMKLAIIMGVSQMMFGLILGAVNAVYFRKMADLLLVVLPTIIFMLCLFVYLVFLIFFKWLAYGGHKDAPQNAPCAPSILIMFIDMVLFKDSIVLPEACDRVMYPGQKIVQYVLVVVALCMVPILLAGKPIYLKQKQRKLKKTRGVDERRELGENTLHEVRHSLRYNLEYEDDALSRKSKPDTVEDIIEFDMSEVWIHSGIHCIETVLGSVSHTASYLRLWALSLAHDQLSSVLWSMVLRHGLVSSLMVAIKAIIIVVTFSAWATLTIAILVAMEGLSAFLHTLRLHWVEFQSKFYVGAGEYFTPFKFERSTIRT